MRLSRSPENASSTKVTLFDARTKYKAPEHLTGGKDLDDRVDTEDVDEGSNHVMVTQ